ncbi:MAG TPA: hypothetical protein VG650_07395 [Mycobacteriales bacterium]|nr:hypothetical protein [Mycobacteriales bacterium]
MALRCPSLAAIRRATAGDAADGTIRLLFVREGGRVGLVQTPQEAANEVDQFLALYLERMITDVAAAGVVVAVHRHDGRPSYADRQLWVMLGARLAPTPTTLLDLVVVGAPQVWSARRGRPLIPPRRRRANQQTAARRSASRATAR